VVVLALATLMAVACRSRRASPPPDDAPLPLPAPPAGLLAELSVPSPGSLYTALRRESGQEARLPASPALLLGGVWDLPVAVAGALVMDRPVVGVLLAGDDAGLAAVVGCRVKSGAEVLRELTTGAAPSRQSAPDSQGGLAVLRGGTGPVLGVAGDWLLASSDEAALRSAGLYVARTLARRPAIPEPLALEVGSSALRGPLDRVLRTRWQRTREQFAKLASEMQASQGRPADLGDPAAILAKADSNVSALLATLSGSDRLRLTLTPGELELEVGLDLEPTPGGSIAAGLGSLGPVSLAPLLGLPGEAQLALVTRLDAGDLGVGEGTVGGAVAGLLGAGDGTTTLALLPGPGVVLRRRVQEAHADQGLPELVTLLEGALAKGALGPGFGKPRTTSVKLAGLGATARRVQATLRTGAPSSSKSPAETVDLLALIRSEELFVAVTQDDARALLTRLAATPADGQLGKDAELRALLARHEGASTAVLANLGSLVRAPRPAAALLTWGRRERRVHASLALSPGALGLLGGLLSR